MVGSDYFLLKSCTFKKISSDILHRDIFFVICTYHKISLNVKAPVWVLTRPFHASASQYREETESLMLSIFMLMVLRVNGIDILFGVKKLLLEHYFSLCVMVEQHQIIPCLLIVPLFLPRLQCISFSSTYWSHCANCKQYHLFTECPGTIFKGNQ